MTLITGSLPFYALATYIVRCDGMLVEKSAWWTRQSGLRHFYDLWPQLTRHCSVGRALS